MYKHKEGISLRKVFTGDLHALLALKNESWWGTHGTPIINIEDQRAWYDNLGSNSLAMIAEKEGEAGEKKVGEGKIAVGVALYTDIDWIARTLNLSGSIFKQHRNIEVVKSAFSCGLDFCFEVLNMHRVSAEVLETHLAAQKLEISHLGFKVEGRRRQSVFKSGRYYDSIVLGILKKDWENTDRVKSHLQSDTGCCNDIFDHVQANKMKDLSRKWIGDSIEI